MIIPGSANPLLAFKSAGAAQYQVQRSLRFNSADSAYLSRTFGTPTTQNTFTFSAWVKRSNLSTIQQLFGVSTNHSFGFTGADALNLTFGGVSALTTTAVFRDIAAWYHIVWTQSGTSHTIYVNNVSVGTATATSSVFNTAVAHQIGAANTTNFLNGYLADVYFIDGQALTPSSFTETDATTGQLIPKAYSGSYGTNGFKLTFSDNSGTTSTTLGKDAAGSNNWTPTNFSVTAGANNDSLTDVPTSYGSDTGVGGEVRGNYATLNDLDPISSGNFSDGNLQVGASKNSVAITTIKVRSGKWYWEISNSMPSATAGVYGTAASSMYAMTSANTVYGFRFDADAGTLEVTSNGSTWTSVATGLTSGPYSPYYNQGGMIGNSTFNFGQRAWNYTAPTGYKALCTTNLPAPTITKSSTAIDTVLYTGTGSALTPTSSLGFSPDLIWIKSRSGPGDHAVYDSVRGVQARLETNNTDAEVTSDNGVTAFDSNGFTLGTLAQVNTNASTYAAWCWDESVSAGFDIVTYTGNGTSRTISHNLGVAPKLIIIKQRTAATTTDWYVYHDGLGSPTIRALLLNSANGVTTGAWSSTAPTSTVFSVDTKPGVNGSNGTYVAYLWAPVTGYSAFGSYTGNGAADGPFVYLGFRPAVILIKGEGGSTDWLLFDSKRLGYNSGNSRLFPNQNSLENAGTLIDITSNGFKVRSTNTAVNTSGSNYVYAAWAEFPFQYARAR